MARFEPGWLRIRVTGDPAGFLNGCSRQKIPVERFSVGQKQPEGYIPAWSADAAKETAEKLGSGCVILGGDRINRRIKRIKRRIGLILWPAAAIGALLFSQCFLWTIGINGLGELSETLILTTAEEAGLYKGRFLPACDMEAVADHILLNVPGVSFCAVNRIGARVEIELIERHDVPTVRATDPCSIYANETGRIVSMEVTNGEETVQVGETIGKGQLLINGVTESADGKLRYLHASGKVIADVPLDRRFSLPLETIEHTATGRTDTRYALTVFSGEIPLYLPEGMQAAIDRMKAGWEKAMRFLTDGPEADPPPQDPAPTVWESQTEMGPLKLFGVRLPIGLITEHRTEYTADARSFSDEEALALLQEAAADWEKENLAEAEIRAKEEVFLTEEGEAILLVHYVARMEIGIPRKIEVEGY